VLDGPNLRQQIKDGQSCPASQARSDLTSKAPQASPILDAAEEILNLVPASVKVVARERPCNFNRELTRTLFCCKYIIINSLRVLTPMRRHY
jgi:hypothetical protein